MEDLLAPVLPWTLNIFYPFFFFFGGGGGLRLIFLVLVRKCVSNRIWRGISSDSERLKKFKCFSTFGRGYVFPSLVSFTNFPRLDSSSLFFFFFPPSLILRLAPLLIFMISRLWHLLYIFPHLAPIVIADWVSQRAVIILGIRYEAYRKRRYFIWRLAVWKRKCERVQRIIGCKNFHFRFSYRAIVYHFTLIFRRMTWKLTYLTSL